MKQTTRFYALLLCISFCISAEKTKIPKIPAKLSGFIKHESYWDTRQVVGFQDDDNLFYPKPKKLDANCCDINAKGQFDMLDVYSRLKVNYDGPEIKHAKLDGVMEVDFVGKSGITNIIAMRLAYLTLTWKDSILLGGQDFCPLYIKECYADTISRNSGRPMELYARNPQIKVIYQPYESFKLYGALLSQLDFVSDGPEGPTSRYLRHAVAPMIQARFDVLSGEHIFGIGGGFKRLIPRLETDTGAKARESINSGEVIAFAALNWETFKLRNKLMFVQNGTDMAMLSGYAVTSIDPINDNRTYTNINAIAWWLDCDITKHPTFIPGLFLGFIKNLGAHTCIVPNETNNQGIITDRRIYGIGTDIDYVLRASPRFKWITGAFEFGAEVEYTRAAYGTINNKAEVVDTEPVGNTRLMVAMYYYF